MNDYRLIWNVLSNSLIEAVNPDWYTGMYEYATFNKDSALELIKTLPDTSAYNGINTIKFKGGSGHYTGGAIRDLTEEEIAIATAKGWTVTLAS